jgi:hypothetical protein
MGDNPDIREPGKKSSRDVALGMCILGLQ